MKTRESELAGSEYPEKYFRAANRIVDLGCGDGAWLDTQSAAEAIGIDIGAGPSKASPDRSWTFIGADLDAGIPIEDGWAAVVRANQVIEHIRNPLSFVSEVHRVLRPNGIFVATTPNIRYLRHLGMLVFRGEGPMTSGNAERTPDSWDDGHIHFYTACDLEWLANAAGFRRHRTEALIDLQGRLRPIRRLLHGTRRHPLVKGFLTGNLLLVAQK
jgi:SAM-dependent methyltransferase